MMMMVELMENNSNRLSLTEIVYELNNQQQQHQPKNKKKQLHSNING